MEPPKTCSCPGGSPRAWLVEQNSSVACSYPTVVSNYVFARNGEAVMVVWNEVPVTETIYLGENVTQVDPWGRRRGSSDKISGRTTN